MTNPIGSTSFSGNLSIRTSPLSSIKIVHSIWLACALIVLCIMFSFLAIEALSDNSLTIDEIAHVPAGLAIWEKGDFALYHENPPFIRAAISLPVYFSNHQSDYNRESVGLGVRSEWNVGQSFVNTNITRYMDLYNRSRLAVAACAVLCGCLIFHWARIKHGNLAALICSSLWFLDPNVIAHSGFATLDIGSALVGTMATYLFTRFLNGSTLRYSISSGVMLGFAQASKFSLISLYPAWLLMALFSLHITKDPNHSQISKHNQNRFWFKIVLSFVISLIVLNACYGFQGTFKRIGSYHFVSRLLGGQGLHDPSHAGNRFHSSSDEKSTREVNMGFISLRHNILRHIHLSYLPIPLPEQYVQGFDSQKADEEVGLDRLSHGKIVVGGRYIEPLATLAYKLPLGTIVLLTALSINYIIKLKFAFSRSLIDAIPAFVLIGLLCTQTGLNWAVRYVIPAFPYLFVCLGAWIRIALANRIGRILVISCILWNLWSLIYIRPYYLSFGNEIVGGPIGAGKVFLGSNYDWGQDLFRLRRWSEDHPYALPLIMAYYGPVPSHLMGYPTAELPPDLFVPNDKSIKIIPESMPRRSYFCAVSSNYLNGLEGPIPIIGYGTIRGIFKLPGHIDINKPYARIGYSILIYRIDPTKTDIKGDGQISPTGSRSRVDDQFRWNFKSSVSLKMNVGMIFPESSSLFQVSVRNSNP